MMLTKNIRQHRILESIHLDPLLFGLIILLGFAGIMILFSASSGNHAMVVRQATRLLGSFFIMLFIAQIPPHKYQLWAPPLFAFGIVLLVFVLVLGKTSKGAQRWIDLKVFRIQPSEFMKIIVPMMLAWYFSHKPLPIQLKNAFFAFIILAIPGLLIAKQPDLGTALLVIFSGCAAIFFAGISYRFIFSCLALCTCSAPFLWHILHDYQKQRILTFLDPERDPLGSGYHIIQSKIAIGSGGLFGKGYLNGTQSHLHFLPEHATDFIFSVYSEEFGFVGTLLLIALFCMIVYRSLNIAFNAKTSFEKILAICLTINFFLSVFVNIGMVSGILPVVGIPLPLVSYGGSSLMVFFASFGMIMSIHATSQKRW